MALLKLGLALALALPLAGCDATTDDEDGEGGAEAAPDGPMCLARTINTQVQADAARDIDMVFAVGNTASMADEQTALAAQFPRLITILSTGDINGDGLADFLPAQSLRLAVVSADLGLPGVDGVAGCTGLGDDGMFQGTGNADVAGCSATSDPPFLSFSTGADEPSAVAMDLACIATLGTDGCTIQQPLESTLKALWPAADPTVTFVTDPSGLGKYGQAGPGAPNGAFVREGSLVALVVVTDEDDCSAREPSFIEPEASANSIDTRCFFEGLSGVDSDVFAIDRYSQLFKMLQPGHEQNVFFTVIAGVPARLTEPDFTSSYDLTVAHDVQAYADAVLADPDMQERIDDRGTPQSLEDDGLTPSCDRGENAKAYPPRRLVQVAKGLGKNGIIASICQDDLTPAINSLIDGIRAQLGVPCLPQRIARDTEGNIGCELTWELPADGEGSAGCGDLPFLTDTGDMGPNRRTLCKVDQLAVNADKPVDGDGWYYDDFSEEAELCVGATSKQRIAFSEASQPPAGATVWLSCFEAGYHVERPREDELANVQQAEIGSPCDEVVRNNRDLQGDSACALYLQNGDVDESMFCHEGTKTCALHCNEDDDCPELWHCDDTRETVEEAGAAMCTPSSCSAGPGSASAKVVGEPCLPYAVPEGGFEDSTVYVEGNQADCGGGACIVFHLDGDPRQDCVLRGGCDPSNGSGCAQREPLRCADASEVEKRAYCSCRCDAPEGFAECQCPAGFSCVEALANAPPEIAGSYCVRKDTVFEGN